MVSGQCDRGAHRYFCTAGSNVLQRHYRLPLIYYAILLFMAERLFNSVYNPHDWEDRVRSQLCCCITIPKVHGFEAIFPLPSDILLMHHELKRTFH